jgi:hypothetical protein
MREPAGRITISVSLLSLPIAIGTFTVFLYSAGNVPYGYAVQVSDTTMLVSDYMLTTK